MIRISSPERGRGDRSMISSAARRTAPTSRRPQASVSEKIDVSARPAACCSTCLSVICSPPAQVVSLSISVASSSRLSPTMSTSARHASASALPPRRANCSATQSGSLRFDTSYASTWPAFATAFVSAESALIPSPTSASTVAGAGARRYAATSFTSAAFQRSTSSTITSRPSPTKRPSALHVATASAPVVSRALRCSVASAPTRSRRRCTARVIFGRSLPVRR